MLGSSGRTDESHPASGELVQARLDDLEAVRSDWNRLAVLAGSPFLSYEWLSSWWRALGDGEPLCALLRADDGTLRAGAWCQRSPTGELRAPTDPKYSEEWDVVASDDSARRDAWQAVVRFGARRLEISPLPDARAHVARDALRSAGYRIVQGQVGLSPYLPLPDTWDELLRSVSRNLRSQYRRSRRDLARHGDLVLRTPDTEADVERDLELFLGLEASGWKGRAGTAIVCDPKAERLYRSFARDAARQGWLRLSILESGGVAVAASYGCVFADAAFRLKSGFDERYADCSPGLVLLGEELGRAIDEGLREYNFLGGPDPQKLRWGARTRARVMIRGYRGLSTLPSYAYRAKLRPALGRLRRLARER
jgi:CelD/BcsL family acetyltransferase involved in cellulose biosynthesis